MRNAKVSELKAKLSAYLRQVREGQTVIVYDRNTPIARLMPLNQDADDLVISDESLPPAELKRIQGVKPKRSVDVDKLLRELRQDR